MSRVFEPMWAACYKDLNPPDVELFPDPESAKSKALSMKDGQVFGPIRVEFLDDGGMIIGDYRNYRAN